MQLQKYKKIKKNIIQKYKKNKKSLKKYKKNRNVT